MPEYGFYYTQTLKEWLYDVASATTLPIVNKGKFQKAPFPLAPYNEQKNIVAEIEKQFSRLDEAATALKRIKANLKCYKASVLKAAVEGKLTEDWRKEHREGQGAEWTKEHKPIKVVHYEEYETRHEAADREKWLKTGFGRKWLKRELAAGRTRQAGDVEPASELLKCIISERRRIWEEDYIKKYLEKHSHEPKDDKWKKKYNTMPQPGSDEIEQLHKLPGQWVYVRLGELIDEPKYGTSKKCDYKTNGIGVLRIPNVVNGFIDASDLKFAEFDKKEIQTYILKRGRHTYNSFKW